MTVQGVLDHCLGCKAKCAKEHAEQEGCKVKVTQEEVKGMRAVKSFLKLVQVALMNPAGQKDA